MPDPTIAAAPTSPSGSGTVSTSSSGTDTTVSTPAGEGAGGEPAASSSDSFDFNTLFSASEPDAVVIPEVAPATPAAPATPLVGAEPTASAALAPAAPTPAAQPPVSDGTGTPQTSPQAAPAAPPSLDFSEPAAIAQRILSDRANVEAHVAQKLFTLTPEEVQELETDTVGTIPKLLAKVYVATQAAMLQQIQQIVPLMAQKHADQSKRYEANSAKFFAKWPQLDVAKHGDLVYRYGVVYRQMNPTATLDQMIADLGPLVMQAAGIAAQPSAPAPARAAASVFTPAPNGGAVGLPTETQTSPYAFMGGSD